MTLLPRTSNVRATTESRNARDVDLLSLSHADTPPPPLDFLDEAGRLLAESFLRSTLSTAAGLAMPLLGSWCMIDLIESDESIHRLVILHSDTELQERARRYYAAHPMAVSECVGVSRIRADASSHVVVFDGSDVIAASSSREHRELLEALGARSFLTIAMRLFGRTLGAFTFGSEVVRDYATSELLLAEHLGGRCAYTVDSARTYAEVAMERVKAEHTFAMQDAARAELAYAAGRDVRRLA